MVTAVQLLDFVTRARDKLHAMKPAQEALPFIVPYNLSSNPILP